MLDFTVMNLEEEACLLRAKSMFNTYNADYDWETRRCSITKPGGESPYDDLDHKELYVNGMWYAAWENL